MQHEAAGTACGLGRLSGSLSSRLGLGYRPGMNAPSSSCPSNPRTSRRVPGARVGAWLLCAALSAGPSQTFAGAPRQPESPYLERARFERVRQGVVALAPDLSGDASSRTGSGREDIVAFSSTPAASMLAALKEAYLSRVSIGRAFTVEGWAHLAATDSTTFTLELTDGSRAVIELFDEPTGVRVVFWGLAAGSPPQRRPITELPVRLVPR